MTAHPRKSVVWIAVFLLVLAGLYFAFQPNPVPVDLGEVQRAPMEITVGDEGRTRIREKYEVSAPVTGRILRIERSAGDKVVKNKTALVVIQPGDPTFLDRRNRAQAEATAKAAKSALKLAEADLARVKAEYDFALTELNRAQKLAARDNLSAQKLDRAHLDFKKAGAALATAQATMDMRRFELETAKAALIDPTATASVDSQKTVTVHAPINGRVLRLIRESEAIIQAGTPLMELGDIDDMEAVVDLLSSDAVKVKPGAKAEIVDWGGGKTIAGKVRLIEPSGFTKTSALGIEEQRVNVVIDLVGEKPSVLGLGDGFRINARIQIWEQDNILQAPINGLFRYKNAWAAFVIRDGKAVLKTLELGRRNATHAEVTSGLEEGDQLVLYPGDRIQDGSTIIKRAE